MPSPNSHLLPKSAYQIHPMVITNSNPSNANKPTNSQRSPFYLWTTLANETLLPHTNEDLPLQRADLSPTLPLSHSEKAQDLEKNYHLQITYNALCKF